MTVSDLGKFWTYVVLRKRRQYPSSIEYSDITSLNPVSYNVIHFFYVYPAEICLLLYNFFQFPFIVIVLNLFPYFVVWIVYFTYIIHIPTYRTSTYDTINTVYKI